MVISEALVVLSRDCKMTRMIEDMPRRRIHDITSDLIESIYMSRELSSALSDFFGSKTVFANYCCF